MNSKVLYICIALFSFTVGAYVWKVSHTGVTLPAEKRRTVDRAINSILVYVADRPITTDDIDFEYSLHTRGIFDEEDLTPIPDLGSRYEKELSPLMEDITSDLIRRRMLFHLVKQDSSFSSDDPGRYTTCLEEWQKTVKEVPEVFKDQADSERLKSRLCEKSLLSQYLKEKLYGDISVTPEQIEKYYEDNKSRFSKPKRIVIRQIVLASEKEAKKARAGLNRYNFAQRAKELSITPEAKEGGKLGPFARGEMPRVFDVAFTMRRGDIYGILKSTYGFHLILLEKKLPKVELSLAKATPGIRQRLIEMKQQEEYQKWVEYALNTVPVKTPRPLL